MTGTRRASARATQRVPCIAAVLALTLMLLGCGAPPAPVPPVPVHAAPTPAELAATYAEDRLATMTLPEKVASLLMLHRPGTDAGSLRSFVDTHGLGGLILMGDNVPGSVDELAALTAGVSADPGLPLLLGIDQEGGTVSRLPSDADLGADRLKSLPAQATTDAFTGRSALLAGAGINLNFGIVADVTSDPHSFIYDRVLGTDPAAGGERVAAAVAGERGRVLSTLKHFPGHGAIQGDSHRGIPHTTLSREDWLARVAPPFRAGIEAGAEMVMFGHLAYADVDPLPASLSPEWHAILRTELGFDGVAITDDMVMLQNSGRPEYADPVENAIDALAAGNTMLLYVLPEHPDAVGVDVAGLITGISAAVETGRIPLSGINDEVVRLLTLRRTLSGQTDPVIPLGGKRNIPTPE